jgi:hypothetical protein
LSNTKDDQTKEIISKGISLSFCSNEICELAAISGRVIKNKTIKLAKTIRSYNKILLKNHGFLHQNARLWNTKKYDTSN